MENVRISFEVSHIHAEMLCIMAGLFNKSGPSDVARQLLESILDDDLSTDGTIPDRTSVSAIH